MPAHLYQLKISLLDCEPPVWRRVVVRPSLTFRQLHHVIQAVMGWKDYHLYEFQGNGERVGEPDPEDPDDEIVAAAWLRVRGLLRSAGDRLVYIYDFGDDWRHEILLEDLPPASEHKTHPLCMSGERACPPEDVGGPYGYADWLELLHDEDPLRAEEARVVLGRRFDPERFDVKSANRRLRAAFARRR